MIWLTWRQFRTQAVVAAAALAVLAIILLISGIHVAHAYDTSQVPGCGAHHDCSNAAQNYIQSLKNNPIIFLTYYIGLVLVYLIPAIAGAFWGAPLVARELEARDARDGVEPEREPVPLARHQTGGAGAVRHGPGRAAELDHVMVDRPDRAGR